MGRKIALVTGGSRGIGRAIAGQLAADGLFVCINYRVDEAAARETQQSITAAGGEAVICQFDVADNKAVTAAIKQLSKDHGKIDVLVNNAGIGTDKPLLRAKKSHWDHMIAVNLSGVYNCTHALLSTWVRGQHGSRIVNISSVAGERGDEYTASYSASKAGVIGFTKALARELAPKQITVNAVSPGCIPTDLAPHMSVDHYLKHIPLNRTGTTADVAHAVAFLVSDHASYITGQNLRVDGGLYM